MQEISLQLRREFGESHLYLVLKGEDFGPCPACCINSEGKESLSHCILESVQSLPGFVKQDKKIVFSFLKALRDGKLVFDGNVLCRACITGKVPKKGIPIHQCFLWMLWPHSVFSLSVSSLFPKVIRHLVPQKVRLSILLHSPSHQVKLTCCWPYSSLKGLWKWKWLLGVKTHNSRACIDWVCCKYLISSACR